jgi:inosose dehydratase
MTDPGASKAVIERIRKVGNLLAALKAPFLVMADDQSTERNAFSGRAYDKDCPKLNARSNGSTSAKSSPTPKKWPMNSDWIWYFHPARIATYVETPEECELFYDATSHTNVGLCLDTGHCVYGHGDSVKEAEKYKSKLRFVHIKDCDTKVLEEARRNKWTFEEAIEHKVFTIIGKGNIDFPAFFRTLVEERILRLVGGRAGRQVRRHTHSSRREALQPA